MSEKENRLFDVISQEMSLENIRKSVEVLNQYYRYTGRDGGEQAAAWIIEQLKGYGADVEVCHYPAYTSLPVYGKLETEDRSWRCLGQVYAKNIDNLQAPLVYDELGERSDLTKEEKAERFYKMNGCVVLTKTAGGEFARNAAKAGAKAIIVMQNSWEKQIHHDTLGAVWGTPDTKDKVSFEMLPAVSVNRQTGEELKQYVGTDKVRLSVKTDDAILESTMPIVRIPGKSKKYVLVSGHYDGWYEGITDNAVSDAIMIEFARVFKKNQELLDRGVVIGIWSGHSDARYSGSAWFCDHHWQDLKENCVAHINIDLAGCKNSENVRVRTTLMEGFDFTGDIVREYTHREPAPYIPMPRAADQSFWGTDVPIHIMLKYEVLPEKRTFDCSSGGSWWHSDEDTIDKMDDEITMRDAQMNAKMVCEIANSKRIPVHFGEFFDELENRMLHIKAGVPAEFKPELEAVSEKILELRKEIGQLEKFKQYNTADSDHVIIEIAGGLTRLIYSSCGSWEQDPATPGLPLRRLEATVGMTRENTNAEDYLFTANGFVRQRNRLLEGLQTLIEKCKLQELLWK